MCILYSVVYQSQAWFCVFTSCVDPLHQYPEYPGVTFHDPPVERQFNSSGEHADFNNGVEVIVPAGAVSSSDWDTVNITVQPSFVDQHVFVLPEGIVSASPSYLITMEGMTGNVTVIIEAHVSITSREDADNLCFLEADSSPTRSGDRSVYKYSEVPKNNTEFSPGKNKGRLTLSVAVIRIKKFFKIGRKGII